MRVFSDSEANYGFPELINAEAWTIIRSDPLGVVG
jgi:hypothetical protein